MLGYNSQKGRNQERTYQENVGRLERWKEKAMLLAWLPASKGIGKKVV